ncbi:MAG: GlsB/YeaQ/YmgE family stress response membrane protein [Hyphomicrobiales bacterium]|nr:GlsB/YeaQ/YmgE family stress response membrane protein [Hyphomicrobiales bacterium]
MQHLVVVIVVGVVAGWLAGKIVRGGGFGLIGDLIVGVIGAFIGRWLFLQLRLSIGINFWVDSILTATVGAVILLLVLRLLRR